MVTLRNWTSRLLERLCHRRCWVHSLLVAEVEVHLGCLRGLPEVHVELVELECLGLSSVLLLGRNWLRSISSKIESKIHLSSCWVWVLLRAGHAEVREIVELLACGGRAGELFTEVEACLLDLWLACRLRLVQGCRVLSQGLLGSCCESCVLVQLAHAELGALGLHNRCVEVGPPLLLL